LRVTVSVLIDQHEYCHDRELKLGGSSGGGPLPRMR